MLRLLVAIVKKQRAPPRCWENWATTNYWKKLVAAARVWYFVLGKRVLTAQSR
jgi:hypothetical protein